MLHLKCDLIDENVLSFDESLRFAFGWHDMKIDLNYTKFSDTFDKYLNQSCFFHSIPMKVNISNIVFHD